MTLGEKLARRIFELGDEPGSPTIRIEFKGGTTAKEIGQGGFIECALARFIDIALTEELFSDAEYEQP